MLSAADVGISDRIVDKWQNSDKFCFNERMERAYQAYRETQEQENQEWVRESNHNTQIYRIFHMKAIWREKYGDSVTVVGMEPVRQMLDRLREMGAAEVEERKRLEAGAAEGDYRELGENDQK